MQVLMANFGTIILWIGIIDAVAVLGLGFACAVAYLFNWNAEKLYTRVVPAVGILIGTSVAAGIIMAITRAIADKVT